MNIKKNLAMIIILEVALRRYIAEQLLLKILNNAQELTYVGALFLTKFQDEKFLEIQKRTSCF